MDALGRADGKLMTLDPHGRPVLGALAAKLERTIAARKIDIVMLDPFIKSHGIAENDNNGIDAVAQILTDMSIKFDIAVDVPHHMAKGPADPGNANRGRGASSLKDALRLVRTATVMTTEEAKAFGLSEAERRRLIRDRRRQAQHRADGRGKMVPAGWRRYRQRHRTLPERRQCPDRRSVEAAGAVRRHQRPGHQRKSSTRSTPGLPDGNRYSDAPNGRDRRGMARDREALPRQRRGSGPRDHQDVDRIAGC